MFFCSLFFSITRIIIQMKFMILGKYEYTCDNHLTTWKLLVSVYISSRIVLWQLSLEAAGERNNRNTAVLCSALQYFTSIFLCSGILLRVLELEKMKIKGFPGNKINIYAYIYLYHWRPLSIRLLFAFTASFPKYTTPTNGIFAFAIKITNSTKIPRVFIRN